MKSSKTPSRWPPEPPWPRPPQRRGGAAEGLRLLDFATLQVQPEQIKAAGYDGALVYVSELRPGANFDSASSVLTGRLVCSQIAESAEIAI